uniref:Uncharacterized protein n=1 Tax=Knipowitschia caucasica TaxID=637954 RepID=A0AAV2LP04_KNICA
MPELEVHDGLWEKPGRSTQPDTLPHENGKASESNFHKESSCKLDDMRITEEDVALEPQGGPQNVVRQGAVW